MEEDPYVAEKDFNIQTTTAATLHYIKQRKASINFFH